MLVVELAAESYHPAITTPILICVMLSTVSTSLSVAACPRSSCGIQRCFPARWDIYNPSSLILFWVCHVSLLSWASLEGSILARFSNHNSWHNSTHRLGLCFLKWVFDITDFYSIYSFQIKHCVWALGHIVLITSGFTVLSSEIAIHQESVLLEKKSTRMQYSTCVIQRNITQ